MWTVASNVVGYGLALLGSVVLIGICPKLAKKKDNKTLFIGLGFGLCLLYLSIIVLSLPAGWEGM